MAACISDPLLLYVLPRSHDASSLAIAQSGGFGVAFVTLVALANRSKPVWPKTRDLAAIVLATAAMVGIELPLRDGTPGLFTFVTQIAGGVTVYATLVALFDIAAIRTIVMGQLRPMVTRFRTS